MALFTDFIEYEFLHRALIGLLFLSLLAGVLSPLIVAKKFAFLGESVGHATFLSLVTTQLFFQQVSPLMHWSLTALLTLFSAGFLCYATYKKRLPSDTLMGLYLAITLALGVILHQYLDPQDKDLMGLFFGNLLLLSNIDLYLLFGLTLITLLAFVPHWKKWIYWAYDEENAELYLPFARSFHFIFFLLLVLVIVSSVKMVGTILSNTYLLIPGAFAYSYSSSMNKLLISSLIFALITSLVGLVVTNFLNTPPGATLTLTQFGFYLLMKTIQYLRPKQ